MCTGTHGGLLGALLAAAAMPALPVPAAGAPAAPVVVAGLPLEGAPVWALLERELIARMEQAVPLVLARYTRPGGELLWPPREEGFASIDALDDAYESFHNWPLLYVLGGGERLLELSHRQFEAVTRQFARYPTGKGYPMVVKEYQPGYDWMHQGEGNLFFYLLCLADPEHPKSVERARRFAGFYLGEDPGAANYDAAHGVIRCAHNGSLGPAFGNFDGSPIWTAPGYGLPFYDVPGVETVDDLEDPDKARAMGEAASARRGRGDAAANLACTSLLLNAYLLTGEDRYRDWVAEYAGAWRRRAAEHGGLLPDNAGLSGVVGEHLEGKWYGANYGWTWPHGWGSLGDAVAAAAQNAVLATGDPGWWDLLRGTMDVLIARAIERDGKLYVPHKYGDPGRVTYTPWPWLDVLRNGDGTALQRDGWFEFMPMEPDLPAHLWAGSMEAADLARARRIEDPKRHPRDRIATWSRKDQGGNEAGWLAYLEGQWPGYPEAVLRHDLDSVVRRVAQMHRDEQDPATYGDSYFMKRNPVAAEALVQLTLGAPLPVYNGGLLVARLRHFHAAEDGGVGRPGLPPDVAALVTGLAADRTDLTLVNLHPAETRRVWVRAGAMGEHDWTTASYAVRRGKRTETVRVAVGGPLLRVDLPPTTRIDLVLGTARYAHAPRYAAAGSPRPR